ncbi:UNVERIFIED_CONTAM: hypothetical protein FKN15_012175 [Acipenser sinensis]
MSGPLVAGPDSQVAAPPGTGGRLVSCFAPPGCPDVAALSPGLAPLPGVAADWSPACAPDSPYNAPWFPFARSRSRQEGAGLWTEPPSAFKEVQYSRQVHKTCCVQMCSSTTRLCVCLF